MNTFFSNIFTHLKVQILWTESKIFRRLVVQTLQRHVRNKIYPQKLSLYFSKVLHLSFNASVNEGTFPSVFKLADVIPIFRKFKKQLQNNYRPISIIKKLSKVFKKKMHINKQLSSGINTFPNNNVGLEKAKAYSNVQLPEYQGTPCSKQVHISTQKTPQSCGQFG